MNDNVFFTRKEAITFLKVSPKEFSEMLKRGKLVYADDGKKKVRYGDIRKIKEEREKALKNIFDIVPSGTPSIAKESSSIETGGITNADAQINPGEENTPAANAVEDIDDGSNDDAEIDSLDEISGYIYKPDDATTLTVDGEIDGGDINPALVPSEASKTLDGDNTAVTQDDGTAIEGDGEILANLSLDGECYRCYQPLPTEMVTLFEDDEIAKMVTLSSGVIMPLVACFDGECYRCYQPLPNTMVTPFKGVGNTEMVTPVEDAESIQSYGDLMNMEQIGFEDDNRVEETPATGNREEMPQEEMTPVDAQESQETTANVNTPSASSDALQGNTVDENGIDDKADEDAIKKAVTANDDSLENRADKLTRYLTTRFKNVPKDNPLFCVVTQIRPKRDKTGQICLNDKGKPIKEVINDFAINVTRPDLFRQYAEKIIRVNREGQWNIYLSNNLVPSEQAIEGNARGSRADFIWANQIGLDVDGAFGNHAKGGVLPPSIADAQGLLPKSITPTRIVFSGGGIQVFFVVNQPLATDIDRDEFENVGRKLKAIASEYERRAGFVKAVDSTFDVPRVMRAPYATNYNPDTPVTAEVIEENDTVYTLAELNELADAEIAALGIGGDNLFKSARKGKTSSASSSSETKTVEVIAPPEINWYPSLEDSSWLEDIDARKKVSTAIHGITNTTELARRLGLIPAKNSGYICPVCANGSGVTGTGFEISALDKGGAYICPVCGGYGDFAMLIGFVHDARQKTAIEAGDDRLWVSKDESAGYPKLNRENLTDILRFGFSTFGFGFDDVGNVIVPDELSTGTRKEKSSSVIHNYTKFQEALSDFVRSQGGSFRGLNLDTFRHFNCGYDAAENSFVIPWNQTNYKRRNLNPDIPKHDRYRHCGSRTIFGVDDLAGRNIGVVVEGEFDAMSIYQLLGSEVAAIAVGSVTESKDLPDRLKEYAAGKILIIAFDSDSTGTAAAPKLKSELRERGISTYYINFKICPGDIPPELTNDIAIAIEDLKKCKDVNDYVQLSSSPKWHDFIRTRLKDEIAAVVEEYEDDKLIANADNESDGTEEGKSISVPDDGSVTEDTTIFRVYVGKQKVVLNVPEYYKLSLASGIWKQIERRVRGTVETINVPVARTLIVPLRFIDGDIAAVEIAYYVHNHWQKTEQPIKTLTTPREISALADLGILIGDNKLLASYFVTILAENNLMPRMKLYHQIGWQVIPKTADDGEMTFTDKEGVTRKFILPTGGEGYQCRRDTFAYENIFQSQGTAEDWRNKLQEVMQKPTAAKIAVVGCCAASILLDAIHQMPIQILLYGISNSGKTALAKFGASLYGRPTAGGLFTSLNSTPIGLQELTVGLNGFPLVCDELELLDAKTLERIKKSFYTYYLGVSRLRSSSSGGKNKQEQFKSVRIFTGEHNLFSSKANQGELKRVLCLKANRAIFTEEESYDLHRFAESHYGAAGRKWISYAVKNRIAIERDFEAVMKGLGENTIQSYIRDHIAAAVIAVVALNHLFVALGGNNRPTEKLIKFSRIVLGELPTKDAISDTRRELTLLQNWFGVHQNELFLDTRIHSMYEGSRDDQQGKSKVSAREGLRGKIYDTNDKPGTTLVAIFNTQWKSVCDDAQIENADKALEHLIDCGYVLKPKDGRKGTVVRYNGSTVRAYIFNLTDLEPADGDISVDRNNDDEDEDINRAI